MRCSQPRQSISVFLTEHITSLIPGGHFSLQLIQCLTPQALQLTNGNKAFIIIYYSQLLQLIFRISKLGNLISYSFIIQRSRSDPLGRFTFNRYSSTIH